MDMIKLRMPLPGRTQLEEQYHRSCELYERVLFELHRRIKQSLARMGLQVTVKYRLKSFDSWYHKILRRVSTSPQDREWTLVTDLLGIRIVCPFMADIPVVEQHIAQEFAVVEREMKGAEFSFKEFGYESLHYLVKLPQDVVESFNVPDSLVCEIQMRTILQDAWAEVEHELVYKSDHTPFDDSLRRKLAALNANLSLADMIFHEIREYQRELQRQMHKRRSDFWDLVRKSENSERDALMGLDKAPVALPEPGEDEALAGLNHIDSVDRQLLRALYAHNAHRYQDALQMYSRILELNPRPAVLNIVLIHRGMVFFVLGEYTEAIKDFGRSIAGEGDHRRAYYYRAVCHRQLGAYAEALDDLNQCLSLDAYQPEALLSRAQTLVKLGDWSAALQDVDAVIALVPHDQEAQRFREVITVKLGV